MSRRERRGRGRALPRVEGRLSPLRHRQGGVHRARRGDRARVRADDPVLLARRAAEHDEVRGRARTRSTSSPPPVSELDGTSETATYGPPYNHATGSAQHILFIHLQKWLGVNHPIDTARTSCLGRCARSPASLRCRARGHHVRDGVDQSSRPRGRPRTRTRWARPRPAQATRISVPAGNYGPVPTMMAALLGFAQSGGLDGALLTSQAVLPDRLHQAAAVHGRRRRALGPRPGRASARGRSGG